MSVLDPAQRLAFTDAVRPPPGYLLEAGLGTTFSLDLEAFTAVVLAFVGADVDEAGPDAATVLTAIARLRHRLRVLLNGGGILAPKLPNQLFALYDRIVHSVRLERTAFHPKVWVLKFVPQERPELRKESPVYRLLCASRNVTAASCWELGARFEGRRGRGSRLGEDLAAFCRKLARESRAPRAVWKLAAELPEVEFEVGREAVESLRFWWQWPGDSKLAQRLPAHADRGLLISPFVRAAFLGELLSRVDALTIVSLQQELDALPESVHQRLLEAADVYVVTGASTDEVPGLDLHAKLLAWEDERTGARETLVGSANATGAGWGLVGSNCEAMLALRPGLRIGDIVKSFVTNGGALRGWIDEYRRQPLTEDDADRAQKRLELLQRELASVAIQGAYDAATQRLTLRSAGERPALLAGLPEAVEVDLVPMLRAQDDGAWAPLRAVFDEDGASFSPLPREELCAFALVRLNDTAHQLSHCFGFQFDLPLDETEARARDEAVSARLLENADPHALLLNVLRGLPAGSGAMGERSRSGDGGRTLLQLATVERVLEACTADRSRIEEIDAILAAFGESDRVGSFRDFWRAFKTALKEAPLG